MARDLTGHIELFSGEFLDFRNPRPEAIAVEDVAHGLAHVCRYTGQCARFYSVAEHAVIVSYRLEELGESVTVQWAGLHHDDAEAFVGDVNRPLKELLPEYRTIERAVWDVVDEALELAIGEPPTEQYEAVKNADNWALSAEAWHLLSSKGAAWFCAGLYDPDRDWFPSNAGLLPEDAEALWLQRYEDLRP